MLFLKHEMNLEKVNIFVQNLKNGMITLAKDARCRSSEEVKGTNQRFRVLNMNGVGDTVVGKPFLLLTES